jgi:hypothetical protein
MQQRQQKRLFLCLDADKMRETKRKQPSKKKKKAPLYGSCNFLRKK